MRLGDRSGDTDLFLCDVDSGEVTHLTPHDEPAEYDTPSSRGDDFDVGDERGRDTLAMRRRRALESDWDVTCFGDSAGRTCSCT